MPAQEGRTGQLAGPGTGGACLAQEGRTGQPAGPGAEELADPRGAGATRRPGGRRSLPTPGGRGLIAGPGAGGLRQLAGASSSSSISPRVRLGSTGTPGPIVVVKVTFLTYRPLAAAGLSLTTSSIAAA